MAALLLHLNGPPGVGKTALARRWAEEHPGTWCCDIDVLRTMVGGWQSDFAGTGMAVREAALAAITAYLATGHDVVLPQFVAVDGQQHRFEDAAARAAARFQLVILDAPVGPVVDRLLSRGDGDELAVKLTELISRGRGAERVVVDARGCLTNSRGTAPSSGSIPPGLWTRRTRHSGQQCPPSDATRRRVGQDEVPGAPSGHA